MFELLEHHPLLVDEPVQLYCYFKVKFRTRIKDYLRKQESHKRKFDCMPQEAIHELSDLLHSPGLINDELLMLRGALRDYRKNLSNDQHVNYEKLPKFHAYGAKKTKKSVDKSLSR
ncbi:TPA: hypothetical protein ACGO4G_001569 [Streptococcus suis]